MEGAYFENGPYWVVNENNTAVIEKNPYAWTDKYNVLYID
jgi:vitellogenic carboxypeptidase-like protein